MDSKTRQKTRTKVIELLRHGHQTVEELARALQLTDNAVRMHLDGLERDGIVRQQGVRRSGMAGKPATIYAISEEAEPTFSRAYAPVLAVLVDTLAQRVSDDELDAVLRETGRRLSQLHPGSNGDLAQRVRDASVWLNALGAVTTVEPSNGHGVMLRGAGCPLSTAVSVRPEVCCAVEELLATLVGAQVRQHCHHGPHPACRFEFLPND